MTIDDGVSVDELREAVEHMHGVPARFVEAVEVDERFNGDVVSSSGNPSEGRGTGRSLNDAAHANRPSPSCTPRPS